MGGKDAPDKLSPDAVVEKGRRLSEQLLCGQKLVGTITGHSPWHCALACIRQESEKEKDPDRYAMLV